MPRIHDHENEITYFARTNYRNSGDKFGIKTDDRRRHVYIVGKTGMGKTTLLENMVLQDIYNGHGLCYMDPHGDTVEKILDYIPSWRINDVVYFNPADLDFPIGFNVLDAVDSKHKHLIAAGLMGVFKKIWENMWSARMEYILGNTILALLDTPGSTLLGINRMYSDEEFRTSVVENIKDPVVKQFWVMEYASYSEKYATEAVAAVQNKIGQFLSSDVIRNIVAQVKSTIDIREIMDSKKIFLVNLSKGRIGEDNSRLLGGMLITKIQLSAMERVDIPNEADREDFYLYVDEFQNFATESFANILSEARKYRLNLIVAHQYMAQLAEEVKDAVLGNVGTLIAFRVGAPDAQELETEFMPRFTPEDIINLAKFQIYLKLMIDGVASQPFSASTLPPIAKNTDSREKIIRGSRERYTVDREDVETAVIKWVGLEGKNVKDLIEDSKARGAGGGKKKEKFRYKCSHCGNDMSIPVQLDRTRPVYCESCRVEVQELKKARKWDARKDLIYDQDLNVIGSVSELGTQGEWAKLDKDGNILGVKDSYLKKMGKSNGGGGRVQGGGVGKSGRGGGKVGGKASGGGASGGGEKGDRGRGGGSSGAGKGGKERSGGGGGKGGGKVSGGGAIGGSRKGKDNSNRNDGGGRAKGGGDVSDVGGSKVSGNAKSVSGRTNGGGGGDSKSSYKSGDDKDYRGDLGKVRHGDGKKESGGGKRGGDVRYSGGGKRNDSGEVNGGRRSDKGGDYGKGGRKSREGDGKRNSGGYSKINGNGNVKGVIGNTNGGVGGQGSDNLRGSGEVLNMGKASRGGESNSGGGGRAKGGGDFKVSGKVRGVVYLEDRGSGKLDGSNVKAKAKVKTDGGSNGGNVKVKAKTDGGSNGGNVKVKAKAKAKAKAKNDSGTDGGNGKAEDDGGVRGGGKVVKATRLKPGVVVKFD